MTEGSSQAALVAACRRLVSLVDAPEPGLLTWHEACARTVEELRGLLALPGESERARVVGVLDGWAAEIDSDYPLRVRSWSTSGSGPGLNCLWSCGGIEEYGAHGEDAWTIFSVPGETPDAARAAAAKWIEGGCK